MHENQQTDRVIKHIKTEYVIVILYSLCKGTNKQTKSKIYVSIFKQYKLRPHPKNKFKYIYNLFLMNCICKFLPIKKLRHKWRNKIKKDIQQSF